MVKRIIILLFLILYSCSSYIVESESSSKKIDLIKNYIKEEKYSKAKIELEYVIMYDPLSEFSNQAQYYLSECYFYLGDYQQAIIEYEKYLSRHDYKSDYIAHVYFMLCKCYFNLSLEYNKDQSDTYIAIDKLQNYIEKDIMKDYINQIEEMILSLRSKLAKKDFYTASLYIKLEEFESANIYYYSIINNYYDTKYVNDALINIALLYFIDNKSPLLFLKNHKSSFLSINDYDEALLLIENLELDQDENYYTNFLR